MRDGARVILASPEETEAFGRRLASLIHAGDVVALFGELGAGKTTLARGILAGLGHDGEVASPTFPLVIPYDTLRVPAWHVDLYRLDHPSEIDELALDEALLDGVLIVEWPERMGSALWPHSLRLTLRREGEGARALTASLTPAWEARWPLP